MNHRFSVFSAVLIVSFFMSQSATSQVTRSEIETIKAKNPGVEWIEPPILDKLQEIKPQKPMTAVQQREVLNRLKDNGVGMLSWLEGSVIESIEQSTAAKELPEIQDLDPKTPVVIAKGRTRLPMDFRGYDKPLKNLPVNVVTDMDGKVLRRTFSLPDGGGYLKANPAPITPIK